MGNWGNGRQFNAKKKNKNENELDGTRHHRKVYYTHLMMATNIQSNHQQQPNRTEKLTTGQMCIRTAVYFMHTISGGDKRRERGPSHPRTGNGQTQMLRQVDGKIYIERQGVRRRRWPAGSADPE